eukprot:comp26843_c0_seq1/m.47121 comp26843_c0_seq1/g.47121  ORF comp26843_c0_seq1/g.47121 comp26843_c0_seq1/m.47121 type:complete len:147 (-) comp26843_c0_seq1:137-577(-)
MALNHVTEVEDIERHEQKYNKELLSGFGVTEKTAFEYAWCLVQSRYTEDRKKGIEILEELLKKREDRDYLYYLALGYYRSADYGPSRAAVHRLLRLEPENRQAQVLAEEIEKAVTRDGLVGLGIVGAVGGVLAVGTIALIAALKKN